LCDIRIVDLTRRCKPLVLPFIFAVLLLLINMSFTFDVLPIITGVPKFRNWSRDPGLCHIFNFYFVIARSRLSGDMFWKCWRSKFETSKKCASQVDGINGPNILKEFRI